MLLGAAEFIFEHGHHFLPAVVRGGEGNGTHFELVEESEFRRGAGAHRRVLLFCDPLETATQDRVRDLHRESRRARFLGVGLAHVGADEVEGNIRGGQLGIAENMRLHALGNGHLAHVGVGAGFLRVHEGAEGFLDREFEFRRIDVADGHEGHAVGCVVFLIKVRETLARRGLDDLLLTDGETLADERAG